MALRDLVLDLYQKGFKDAKGIKSELDRLYPSETHSLNSIRSYLSILKPTESEKSKVNDNSSSVIPDNSGGSVADSSLPSNPPSIETITEQKPKTENLITGSKFSVQAGEISSQPEATQISQNYQQIKEDAVIDPKKLVHVERIGEVAGNLTKSVFKLKPIRKLTHNFELQDKDAKRLDEDMSLILQSRLPAQMSEYADYINLSIDICLVGVKALFHRFDTPLPEEFKKSVEQAEKNVKQVTEQLVKEVQNSVEENRQKEVSASPNGFPMCEGCKQFKPDVKMNINLNKFLCAECDYKEEVKIASKDNSEGA